MKKKLTSLLLSLALILTLMPVVTVNAAAKVVVTSLEMSDAGMLKIRGYYSGYDSDIDGTILITSESSQNANFRLSNDNCMWIDQVPLGNNGAFSYTVHINQKFSEKAAYIALGGGGLESAYRTTIDVPELPPDISVVENNSTMFGRDFYYVNGTFYNDADRIADSFAFGGNHIYYKIGGNWYDLLNPKATSSAYLTKANAVDVSTVTDLVPRYYYAVSNIFTLRYYALELAGN